jgi:hypothetical protein
MLPTIREGALTQVRHQERARTLPGGQARYEGRMPCVSTILASHHYQRRRTPD